jgi:hypothetical protein
MFAYAAPAPPSGGVAWQDAQPATASGDAAAWHDWQTGPDFEVGADSSWQAEQDANSAPVFTAKWAGSLNGTGCATAAVAWHSVELKQSGAVPAGAGGLGGGNVVRFAPLRWQIAHIERFPGVPEVTVFLWV